MLEKALETPITDKFIDLLKKKLSAQPLSSKNNLNTSKISEVIILVEYVKTLLQKTEIETIKSNDSLSTDKAQEYTKDAFKKLWSQEIKLLIEDAATSHIKRRESSADNQNDCFVQITTTSGVTTETVTISDINIALSIAKNAFNEFMKII